MYQVRQSFREFVDEKCRENRGGCFSSVRSKWFVHWFSFVSYKEISFLGNNRIDFNEFLIAYALTSIGDPVEKLSYAFSLFDKDHSETIEPNEMIESLDKLCSITGRRRSNQSTATLACDIFHTLDIDHNQKLTRDEFINGCLKNDFIRCMLSPFERI